MPGRVSLAGIIAVLASSIILAVNIARLTIASKVAESNPKLSLQLAPLAPEPLISTAMAQVGEAAAQGNNPRRDTLDRFRIASGLAPLQPEPFLVEGALAEKAGDYSRAEMLLKQARTYSPRSIAARYLLADLYLRQGKVLDGLSEMMILTKLVPSAAVQMVPALANYARTPGGRDKLTRAFRLNPNLRSPVLNSLAADPSNADLLISLAGPDMQSDSSDAQLWKSRLLNGLISRGEYDRAYSLWREFAGIAAGKAPLVFNGDFRHSSAPQPFNWALSPGNAGLVEYGNGNLRVLYFGRDDATLASELLLLKPGNYTFSLRLSGNVTAGTLSWRLRCVRGRKLLQHDFAFGNRKIQFTVPASDGCQAQRLELIANAQETPEDSDVQVGPVQIERSNV